MKYDICHNTKTYGNCLSPSTKGRKLDTVVEDLQKLIRILSSVILLKEKAITFPKITNKLYKLKPPAN